LILIHCNQDKQYGLSNSKKEIEMYDKNAINYGLNRNQVIASLNLSAAEKVLLSKIEKFLLDTGYYHTSKIQKEIKGVSGVSFSDTLADFFGNSDPDGQKFLDDSLPEVALAEKINAAWDVVVAQAEADTDNAKVSEVMARVNNHTATNDDLRFLVSKHLAYEVYDDPESNAPTGIIIGSLGDGNPYVDQVETKVFAY